MLRQVSCRRCLTASALEIHNGDDLDVLLAAAMGNIAPAWTAGFVEIYSKLLDLLRCIGTPSAARDSRCRPLSFQGQVAQVTAFDAEQLCCFRRLERAERLLSCRRKEF